MTDEPTAKPGTLGDFLLRLVNDEKTLWKVAQRAVNQQHAYLVAAELSPILAEIHDALWDFEADHPGVRHGFTPADLKSALKILMCVLLEMMWLYQEQNGVPQEEREAIAVKTGKEIRQLVKRVTEIDPPDLYKQ